jgi:cytochrome oxidase Cu insertion factor (SCO1/SenC/PrrC family)
MLVAGSWWSFVMRTIFAIAVLTAAPLFAQHDHHHEAPPRTSNQQPATRHIPDVAVQTQAGSEVHFYSDLLENRVTAVNFIFTSCTTVCPLMGVRFAQLQPLLPKDVSLVSVSIDPTNDTPARLEAWAHRVGAKPGWTLVTGAKPDIDDLLRSLGTQIADPASHTPLILIIDDRGGKLSMQRVDGLADPKTIARLLSEAVR